MYSKEFYENKTSRTSSQFVLSPGLPRQELAVVLHGRLGDLMTTLPDGKISWENLMDLMGISMTYGGFRRFPKSPEATPI